MRNLILLPIILIMAASGYLLYQDYVKTSTSIEETALPRPIGLVLATENNVRRQSVGASVWDILEGKSPLFLGDLLRVADASWTHFKTNDASEVILEGASLVRFEKENMIDLKLGDLVSYSSTQTVFFLTRGAEIRGDGADLRIETDANGKTTLTALRNKVTVTDKNKKTLVLNQEDSAELKDGVILPPLHKAPVFLKSPPPLAKYESGQGSSPKAFSWNINDPLIKDDRLQLSKGPIFSTDTTSEIKGHSNVSTVVSAGLTYWRVAYTQKNQPLHTEARLITAEADVGLELSEPENGAELKLDPPNNQVTFSWSSGMKTAKSFSLELSKTSDFQKISNSQTVKAQSATVKDLISQKYYWRVKALGDKNEGLGISSVSSFTASLSPAPKTQAVASPKPRVAKKEVAPLAPLAPPVLLEPATQKVFTGDKAKILNFTWREVGKAAHYHIQVKKTDAKPQPIVILDKVNASTPVVSGPISLGEYSWTVSSVDAKGQEGAPSAPNTFTIGGASEPLGAPKVNPPVIK